MVISLPPASDLKKSGQETTVSFGVALQCAPTPGMDTNFTTLNREQLTQSTGYDSNFTKEGVVTNLCLDHACNA